MEINNITLELISYKFTHAELTSIWRANNKAQTCKHSKDAYDRKKNDPEFLAYRNEISKKAYAKRKIKKLEEKKNTQLLL